MAVPELVHMTGMGLLTSVLAPLVTVAGRRSAVLRTLTWPAWIALPGFLALHAAITVLMGVHEPRPPMHAALDALLLAGAVIFWLPVLGQPGRRLDDLGRCVYLFLAAPSLDLPAVVLVARGDSVGGLAMIVAMLPIGLAAVALIWRVMTAEEAAARRVDQPAATGSVSWELPYADS
jgi:cytochrome c oxidase assembly factor CtaG